MTGDRIRCELTSADIPAALQAITCAGYNAESVTSRGEMTVSFEIDAPAADDLRRMLEARGHQLRIMKRMGLSHPIGRWLRHPLLLGITAMLLLLTICLPTRVLFVRVNGNIHISANKILEQAEACGITWGANRGDVRSERVKNALLEAMPELQWVGVNTTGCVATVSVRERSRLNEEEHSPASVIVASRDGIVRTCTVHQGTALCAPGQAVRAGEILISGLTDCSLAILVTGAEGEVFAETSRSLMVTTPENALHRRSEGASKQKISLLIGKKRINFYNDSGILDSSCVKMYSEYYITLPGGFRLPLGIAVETVTPCVTEETAVCGSDLPVRYARAYLLEHMVAGQILEERTTVEGARRYAQYICLEMIGQERYEEIARQDGEIDGENG